MNIHLATQCFQSTIPLFSDQSSASHRSVGTKICFYSYTQQEAPEREFGKRKRKIPCGQQKWVHNFKGVL